MGEYATVENVQAHQQEFALSATTKPTLAQVEEWIEETGAEIDGYVAALGYVVPVVEADSPIAHAILRRMQTYYVAALLEDAAFTRASPNQSTHSQWLMERYERCVGDLIMRRLSLPDAVINEFWQPPASDDLTARHESA